MKQYQMKVDTNCKDTEKQKAQDILQHSKITNQISLIFFTTEHNLQHDKHK